MRPGGRAGQPISARLLAVLALLVAAAAGFFTGTHAAKQASGPGPIPVVVRYTAVSFADLRGWDKDDGAGARDMLLATCARTAALPPDTMVGSGAIARPVQTWRAACDVLVQVPDFHTALAAAFEPYDVAAGDGTPEGLFTGYYESEVVARPDRAPGFDVPIYGVPRNLVTVDLRQFGIDLPTIAGRVDGGQLKPFYTRAEIDDAGAIAGDADVLFWADDPVAVHILHIQGSGRLRLPDGTTAHVGYAASNGRAFRGIGTILADAGVLPAGKRSMIDIRDWLRAHPDQARDEMNRNARYIFFRKTDGPVGAAGVALTAGRALAVDPRYVPLGAPLWLDTTDPDGAPIDRLVVAADVGAAITGPVRGDLFWGGGEEAFEKAARMKSRGRYAILVPRAPTH